ncbi:FkbM family methyltransferase [Sinanaerobacter chloroacetimidivorans]|uniref:FkbM family methyltransferase n=1 Tax=Sinanaerobacter chloroacetimidivorans TaxID=2818044 RepID=A0A8J8AZK9_9FIRM|nr:FkbM family methyltransferase [Sinanaerobacter chloroacetimidivorans]MBR0596289.1 FkbM family methyltransferase [Sinanaerobacter chloroacetimidivorans]
MPNKIDKDFNDLMGFLGGCNLEQTKAAVKRNLNFYKNTDKTNYTLTINYYNKYKLWGTIDPDNDNFELVDNIAEALVDHREDFQWLYGRLCDNRSKKILSNLLSYWFAPNYRKVSELQDKIFHQYFDLDLIQCKEDEVFVDIGAYIGDTAADFVKTFGSDSYKRIYCYEIVPENQNYIDKNIELLNLKNVINCRKGASDKSGIYSFISGETTSVSRLSESGERKIPTVAIDDDIEENVTFIKMDVEGSEEQALKGCRKKILENHPKLALSVYHSHKDLWKLARMIDELDPSYRFYLRYYGKELLPTEYILYAL